MCIKLRIISNLFFIPVSLEKKKRCVSINITITVKWPFSYIISVGARRSRRTHASRRTEAGVHLRCNESDDDKHKDTHLLSGHGDSYVDARVFPILEWISAALQRDGNVWRWRCSEIKQMPDQMVTVRRSAHVSVHLHRLSATGQRPNWKSEANCLHRRSAVVDATVDFPKNYSFRYKYLIRMWMWIT